MSKNSSEKPKTPTSQGIIDSCDFLSNAASTQDCTGLIPSGPVSYAFRIGCITNTFSYISQQQKKAIHHSFVDTERNTVPTTSTKPISSTTVNLVPRTNAERIVAAICILLIRFLFQTAITLAIKTTFRL